MGEYQEVGIIREQLEGWPTLGKNGEFSKGQADFERTFRYLRGNIRETLRNIRETERYLLDSSSK